jgi:hypothetical protein
VADNIVVNGTTYREIDGKWYEISGEVSWRAMPLEQALLDEIYRLTDKLAAEYGLANWLADALSDHMRGEDHPAYTAWEEARREG